MNSNLVLLKRYSLLFTILMFSACAKIPPNSLSQAEVDQLGINQVRVEMAENAQLVWHDGSDEYARMQGCERIIQVRDNETGELPKRSLQDCDPDAVGHSPEAMAWMRERIVQALQPDLEEKLKARFSGSRAVDIEAHVLGVHTISALQAILVGGAHSMTVNIKVKDSHSGDLLTEHPHIIATSTQNGLVGMIVTRAISGDPVMDMSSHIAPAFVAWLAVGGTPVSPATTPVQAASLPN